MNLFFVAELDNFAEKKSVNFKKIVDKFEASYDFITNDGTLFYLTTNLNAPKNKILRIDISNNDVK